MILSVSTIATEVALAEETLRKTAKKNINAERKCNGLDCKIVDIVDDFNAEALIDQKNDAFMICILYLKNFAAKNMFVFGNYPFKD